MAHSKLLAAVDRTGAILEYGRHPVLLGLRLYWGWQFALSGWGKFQHLDRVQAFFESSGVPFPEINVYLASSAELVGGILLLLGLFGRPTAAVLLFVMIMAWATADYAAVANIWADPNGFVTSTPFLYALASLLVLVLGPGFFSVDRVIRFAVGRRTGHGAPPRKAAASL